ncbi:MAG: FimB/Mfa2 family fimbrial subunit, partial [Paludibacteraceae bacterium]|nr:FimB/Mfa2 family fimbrial subunit [Paludibacteraceae bacterium]
MNRILSYLIIGILIPWLFLSCAKDDDVLVGGEDNPITVSFVLSTQNTLTRAAEDETTWGNYDDDDKVLGNDFENQIKSVALIVYNSANEKVDEINEFQYFAANGSDPDGCAESYLLTAEITETIGTTGNYRFVVVTNATLKAGDVDNSTYSIADINTTGIPMWGAVTKSVSTNSNVDLGTIHLLRAVAKIELKLATTISSQFNIGDAKITKSNSKGYVFPAAKTVESTLNLNHAAQSFNPLYNDSDLSSNLVFTTASDKKSSYIYVTEWATIVENPKIALQILDGSKTYPFEIELKDYVDGKPTGDYHNIVRNHHYQYTITSVNIGASLKLECSVLDWEEDLEEWVYSDVPMVSTNNGHINWTAGVVNDNRVNLTPS